MDRANEKIQSIILLRAVAAVGVCLIHISLLSGFSGKELIYHILNYGADGVAVFFVISGFVLPYSLYKNQYQVSSFFQFLLKRVIRIDPPYWASIILIFLIGVAPLTAFTFGSLLLHLTYAVPFVKGETWLSDVYWTLSVEFQYYLLLGLSFPYLMKLKPIYAIGILVAITVLFMNILNFQYPGLIFTNIFDFVFGYIVFLGYVKKIESKIFIAILIGFTLYLIFGISFRSGIAPFLSGVFIYLYRRPRSVPILSFLGNISYSLYLIHIPISLLFIRFIHPYIKNPLAILILTLLVSVGSAYIFNVIIERPSMRLSKRISFKKKSLK